MAEEETSSGDIINIIFATDIHLGYCESDPVRGNDSFITFEEILTVAQEQDVDFILLGGNLFHDAKPSLNSLSKCTALLRKYCFGDKPVRFEIISDQKVNFPESMTGTVNYEDPNLNIAYPVFSIHGDRDDTVGHMASSCLDVLSKMGGFNYFGKNMDSNRVKISPVLMKKGATNIALYGLSFMKEQKLMHLFKESKVEIEKIDDEMEWFSILTLHQKRTGSINNHLPEEVLPDFLDLVVWGHEHECKILPERNFMKHFHVVQPGSTIATSLTYDESRPKHCALLQVCKKEFKLLPLKLQTVRPFTFKTVILSEENLGHPSTNEHNDVQNLLKEKITALIDDAKTMESGHHMQPVLPLVKLLVYYERETQNFNQIRFSQQFAEWVANPGDVLSMKRERKLNGRKLDKTDIDTDALEIVVKNQASDDLNVEAMLEKYYKDQPENKQLSILSAKAMGDSIKDFILRGNDEVFRRVLDMHKETYIQFLMVSDAENISDVAKQIALCKESMGSKEISEFKYLKDTSVETKQVNRKKTVKDISSEDDDDSPLILNRKLPSRGRGRGRGSRGGKYTRGAHRPSEEEVKTEHPNVIVEESSSSEDDKNLPLARFTQPPSKPRGRGRGSHRSRGVEDVNITKSSVPTKTKVNENAKRPKAPAPESNSMDWMSNIISGRSATQSRKGNF